MVVLLKTAVKPISVRGLNSDVFWTPSKIDASASASTKIKIAKKIKMKQKFLNIFFVETKISILLYQERGGAFNCKRENTLACAASGPLIKLKKLTVICSKKAIL